MYLTKPGECGNFTPARLAMFRIAKEASGKLE